MLDQTRDYTSYVSLTNCITACNPQYIRLYSYCSSLSNQEYAQPLHFNKASFHRFISFTVRIEDRNNYLTLRLDYIMSSAFFDNLNPFNWTSKKKGTGNDEPFIDALKLYPDLWRDLFLESNIICCPISGSLRDDVTKDQLLSHILVHQRIGGEYKTSRGQHVSLSGSELICGAGFVEPREVKVISISEITDSNGKTATMFRISRPLVGGVSAPEDSDEINLQATFRYLTVLRSFPEAESCFIVLDDYIREINFVGSKSLDGFSRIQPSLAASLQLQWQHATEKLCKCSALVSTLGNGGDTKRLIGQIIESYLIHSVSQTVYPWMCTHRAEEDNETYSYMETLRYHTQSDLGISSELQCCQIEAIKELRTLCTANTPVDKLLVLKRTVRHIRLRIDRNVQRKFPFDDVELATDDIVLLIVWCLLQLSSTPYQSQQEAFGGKTGAYNCFLSDLVYAATYHFNTSSKSELGFTLCHFQVAADWFTSRSRAFTLRKRMKLSAQEDRSVIPSYLPLAHSLEGDRDSEGERESEGGEDLPQAVSTGTGSSNGRGSAHSSSVSYQAAISTSAVAVGSSASVSMSGNCKVSPKECDAAQRLGLEYFQGVCVVAAERNLEWIRRVSRQHRTLSSRSPATSSDTADNGHHPDTVSPTVSLQGDRADTSAASVSKHSTHRLIQIVGLHPGCVCQHRETASIISERTNKPGGVAVMAGARDAFAAVNEDGRVYTWGMPECGRLGRGKDSCQVKS